MKILLIISLLLTGMTTVSFAQYTGQVQKKEEDEDEDPYDSKDYFMYGLNYLSDNVYLGRKDSSVLPYVGPYIGYHFKDGVYGKATASYAPTKGYIDVLTLEAGYDHTFGDHLNTGIAGDRFYYNKNSTSIRANTVGSIMAYGQWTNPWLEPQVNWAFDFNKASTDYVLGLFLDHDFSLSKGTLHIFPMFGLNTGTQHYYDEYFTTRENKKDKTVKVKHVLANPSQFVPLDYEASVKATFRTGAWLFTLIPTYAIPTSPSTITKANGKQIEEKLTNSFFVELDICHR